MTVGIQKCGKKLDLAWQYKESQNSAKSFGSVLIHPVDMP